MRYIRDEVGNIALTIVAARKHGRGYKIHGVSPRRGTRAVHGRCGADHALSLQFIDVLIAQPQFGQQFTVVLSQQGRGLRMDSVEPTGRPERQGAVRRSRVHRMVDIFEKPAHALGCGSSDWRCGCITLATGTPWLHSAATMSSPRRSSHQALSCSSMRSWC